MKVKQALERLRMRCGRSEHSRSQAEKLLRRWIAASSGRTQRAVGPRREAGSGVENSIESIGESRVENGLENIRENSVENRAGPGMGPERKNERDAAENPGMPREREEKQLTAEDIPYILHLLEKEKFIDDRRFAGAYVRDKLRLNGWGKNKISYMLRSLGVEEYVIREALAENYREADTRKEQDCPDAGEVLRKLVENKWKSLKKSEPLQNRKMKVLRFAVGRGFEYSRVLEILQEITENEREERDYF